MFSEDPSDDMALTPKKGTSCKFKGRIALEKFGQFAETEEVVVEPENVQPENAPVNAPVNVVVTEEHVVQIVVDEEPHCYRIFYRERGAIEL
ncbi:hypothetical protein Hanom_Chr07g00612321 [Helianthus anomalus]